ncbi:hypothetical protein N7494_002064 [Penicillium frequentans]|uniref:Uncharacterized protein n=1 Tax=Penicillium frequentans TaxID=3151616 RepID=A0AAD6GJU5_9EURO|nr:hypothetical protein N7494_002064 [Penicillium glabrum]
MSISIAGIERNNPALTATTGDDDDVPFDTTQASRDWDSVVIEPRSSQADRLPASSFALCFMGMTLKKTEEYDVWKYQVMATLKSYGIDALVDSSIPRPLMNDPKAKRWYDLSVSTGTWLLGSISDDLNATLRTHCTKLTFGDDVFTAIQKEMRSYGIYGYVKLWQKFDEMKVSDYPDIAIYLDEFVVMHTKMTESSMGLTPYTALLRIMTQLSAYTSLRDSVMESVRLSNVSPANFTNMQLHETIHDIRGRIFTQQTTMMGYAATQVNKDQKKFDQKEFLTLLIR